MKAPFLVPPLVALGALALLAGCGDAADEWEGPPPKTVEVVTLAEQTVTDWVDLVGQLESEASVIVQSELRGIIDAIDFVEGQPAAAGDVLVRLRNEEQVAALREAEAKAALAAEVFRRTQKLARQNVSAATELDRARSEREVSKAAVDIARLALERTQIRAPFDGIVGRRLISPGARVDQDTSLVQIDAVDRLQAVFAVPEMGVSAARVGLAVTVRVVPYPGETFDGKVFFVAPALDPRNRQLMIKAWVPNSDRRLKPGLLANLRLKVSERDDALVVPEAAIAYDQQGPYVWRVTSELLAERVGVTLGIRLPGEVEIAAGLSVGDRVVSAGTHKLRPGEPLRFESAAQAKDGDRS